MTTPPATITPHNVIDPVLVSQQRYSSSIVITLPTPLKCHLPVMEIILMYVDLTITKQKLLLQNTT